jgi:hypothetical protein
MLDVAVNGKLTRVPIGSRVSSLLPRMTESQYAAFVRTLRVERPFEGKPVNILFARNAQEISQILLCGGDKIFWSSGRVSRAPGAS